MEKHGSIGIAQAGMDCLVHESGRNSTAAVHISVCICSYRRPESLKRLLEKLIGQETKEGFWYSVVVVDNDYQRSSERAVKEFQERSAVDIKYLIEPQQNIALARNKAVENSAGQFIAFIDDDEFPPDRWLLTLLEAQKRYQADGVLGPVLPHFDFTPPEWVVKGGIFDRPRYRSGYKMPGHQTRTGNVLLRRSMLEGVECPFRPQFGTGGEDVDFFTRMVAKGCQFVWCDEAVVYEEIPESRCTWRYLVKRALLRGSTFPKRSEHRIKDTITSLIAVPFYTLILPFAALFGRHLIIRYLIRLCDHFARLLAMCGWELMTHREM